MRSGANSTCKITTTSKRMELERRSKWEGHCIYTRLTITQSLMFALLQKMRLQKWMQWQMHMKTYPTPMYIIMYIPVLTLMYCSVMPKIGYSKCRSLYSYVIIIIVTKYKYRNGIYHFNFLIFKHFDCCYPPSSIIAAILNFCHV